MENLEVILTSLDQKQYILRHPAAFSCVKSDDTPADSLKASFFQRDCPDGFPEFKAAKVRADGKLLFDGLCDRQEWAADSTGGTVTIEARSRGALLLDNEALPQCYFGVGIEELFRRHIQPYGFHNGIVFPGKTALYPVRKGVSEWEAFAGLCRKLLGRTPFLKGSRVEILPQGGTLRSFHRDSVQVKRLSRQLRRDTGISQVWVRDQEGNYSMVIQNPEAQRLDIRRKRYLIPASQWADTGTDAKLKMQQSLERREIWQVELAGLLDWELGDPVLLDSLTPEGRQAGQMPKPVSGAARIAEIQHRFGKRGAATTIILYTQE